ncbi:MAG: hypothetical protein IJ566_03210 [Cardiobacteriaceae bacterium]|nr:hypothetical protein [Cardiobacteriaceae bacterium]
MKTTAGEVNNMQFIFIPFESIGPFKLDDDVKNYSEILSIYKHEQVNQYGSEYYTYPKRESDYGSHFLQVKEGKIRTVFCYDSVIFQGTNLMGLNINEFGKITNSNYIGEIYEADIFEDEPPMYEYEFDYIGVSVRTHYEKIVDIAISGHSSYEED